LALLGAGCGGSDDGSPSAGSQTTKVAVVESSQTYRDQLANIVWQPDDARRNFHDAPPGELTLASARQLARASRAAAREIDELKPAAGLNDTETAELAALLRAIRESGITVLVVEHNMSLVMNVADQIVVLETGSVIASGTPEEIQRNQRVITAYLGEEVAA